MRQYNQGQINKAVYTMAKIRTTLHYDPIKAMLLYKKNDNGLALARLQASNNIQEIITRHANNLPLKRENKTWLNTWLNDASNGFGAYVRDFVKALEIVTNWPLLKD